MKVKFYGNLSVHMRGRYNDWFIDILPKIAIEKDYPEIWFHFGWLVFGFSIAINK